MKISALLVITLPPFYSTMYSTSTTLAHNAVDFQNLSLVAGIKHGRDHKLSCYECMIIFYI